MLMTFPDRAIQIGFFFSCRQSIFKEVDSIAYCGEPFSPMSCGDSYYYINVTNIKLADAVIDDDIVHRVFSLYLKRNFVQSVSGFTIGVSVFYRKNRFAP